MYRRGGCGSSIHERLAGSVTDSHFRRHLKRAVEIKGYHGAATTIPARRHSDPPRPRQPDREAAGDGMEGSGGGRGVRIPRAAVGMNPGHMADLIRWMSVWAVRHEPGLESFCWATILIC